MLRKYVSLLTAVGFAGLLCGASPALAQTAPPLGATASFGVLGGSAVTAAGVVVVDGDVGSAPTPAVSGPISVSAGHTVFTAANAVTANARTDAGTAFGALASQGCTVNVPADLSLLAQPLVPGVYCMGAGGLTGTITLSGSASAVWVFKTASTLTTAGASNIVMAGGASSCNVYWQVGSSATLGGASTFRGSIFSGVSIGLGTTANITGRAVAGSGAVTMDGSNTVGGCSAAAPLPPSCPVISLNPATLPGGTVGVAFSQTILGSGGIAPYTFAVTSGALPAGLTLTSAGVLAGTPTTAGSSTFTIRGTDFNGCTGSVTYTVVIGALPPPPPVCPAITLTPAATPFGTVGVAYLQTIAGSGGTAPYSFGVTAGALPAGLTLTAGGVLAGTPTTAATSNFTIRGTDAVACFASVAYSIIINAAPPVPAVCPAITLTPATLPNGALGVAYNQTLTASGGSPRYNFGVTSGVLPAGLLLTSDGVLLGTPTTNGTSAFTIRATDINGCFKELSFTMSIITGVPTLPQALVVLLALGLTGVGYFRLRRRARAE